MTDSPSRPRLILASGSPYRADQLRRLGVEFETRVSNIDETRRDAEAPAELVRRLASAKATAIAAAEPDALVIGGDQVATLGDQVLGKPGNRDCAIAQLQEMSGKKVVYLSGLALIGPGVERVDIVPTTLQFRTLAPSEIQRYVDQDQPYDCAGAMRSESRGITLLRALISDDPSALIGLPLIRLAEWLRDVGFEIP